MRYFLPSLLILCFSLIACQRTNKSKIDDDTFVQIYCDIMAMADLVDVEKREALRDSILKSYNTNFEEYQQKITILKNKPEKWLEIYDKIVKELESRVLEAEAKIKKTQKKEK